MTSDDRFVYGRGPFLVRNPKDYPTYPKSGMFRFHGYAKGYMYRWELFLRGRTDEIPPTFEQYCRDTETALRDTRIAEQRFAKPQADQKGSMSGAPEENK